MSSDGKHGSWKTTQVKIQGMHCANCEVLIERRFKKIAGIRKVTARCSTGTAEISYYGDLDLDALQSAVEEDGYTVSDWHEQTVASDPKNTGRDYLEIGAAFLVLVGIFLVLKQLEILPESYAIPNTTVNFGLALLIGVVAS